MLTAVTEIGSKLTAAAEAESCDAETDARAVVGAGEMTPKVEGVTETDGLAVCCLPAETLAWPCGRKAMPAAAIAMIATTLALLAAFRRS